MQDRVAELKLWSCNFAAVLLILESLQSTSRITARWPYLSPNYSLKAASIVGPSSFERMIGTAIRAHFMS